MKSKSIELLRYAAIAIRSSGTPVAKIEIVAAIASGFAILGYRKSNARVLLKLSAAHLALTASVLGYSIKAGRKLTKPIRVETVTKIVEIDRLNAKYRNPRWAELHPVNSVILPIEGDAIQPFNVDGYAESSWARETTIPMQSLHWRPTTADIWFLVSAKYHVRELAPVVLELSARGHAASFAVDESASAGIWAELARWQVTAVNLDEQGATSQPRVVVTMNDWGSHRPLLERLKQRGTIVISKVEGAQDFLNSDTLRLSKPYSFSDLVLTQGQFDSRNVQNDNLFEVGSTRIESILNLARNSLVEKPQRTAVVNYNFAYGTYANQAEKWLTSVTKCLDGLSLEKHLSVHPAVSRDALDDVSPWPLELDLETSSILISRCSTAVFDMLALGRRVVYYNPHNERVWRSVDWPSVKVAKKGRELSQALSESAEDYGNESSLEDLSLFISIDKDRSAAIRTADAIATQIAGG